VVQLVVLVLMVDLLAGQVTTVYQVALVEL
jgi:hypothetical protein